MEVRFSDMANPDKSVVYARVEINPDVMNNLNLIKNEIQKCATDYEDDVLLRVIVGCPCCGVWFDGERDRDCSKPNIFPRRDGDGRKIATISLYDSSVSGRSRDLKDHNAVSVAADPPEKSATDYKEKLRDYFAEVRLAIELAVRLAR